MSFATSSIWRRLSYTFLLTSIIPLQSLFAAGSGSVKGRVVDSETGDALVGANVVIQNTSLGTSSDVNGKFYLPIVPAGKWTLKVTYIGYIQATREVTVAENEQLVVEDFRLTAQALVGQTVVVTAQARGQIGAINQQLASDAIVNVVSEEKIKELPDFNAAEAIGRLPGVSTLRSSGEASKIVVRGIAPQYNLVAIDGVNLSPTGNGGGVIVNPSDVIASSPSQDRSVDVTMITPNMLQAIEVYKTLTPDMDGDAIGGYVNMKLREAPSDFHTDLNWQSGYVKKNSKYDNYKANAVVSNRFFNDALGVYLLGNSEQYDRGADNFNASYAKQSQGPPEVYSPVSVTNFGLDRHFETRSRYGANLILDLRLPNGSIKAINMFSRLKSKYTDYTTRQDLTGSKNLNFNLSHGEGNTDLMTNALQGEYDLGFLAVDLSAANSYSRNFNPHQRTYTFTEEGANPIPVAPETPPERLYQNTHYVDSLTYLQYFGDGKYDYKENGQSYLANIKIPFNLQSSVSGFLKFGGKYRYTHRRNDQDLPYAQVFYGGSQNFMNSIANQFPSLQRTAQPVHSANLFYAHDFSNPDQGIARDFLDNKFGDMIWVPTSTLLDQILSYVESQPSLMDPLNAGWISGPYQNKINDYVSVERFYAGYAMAQIGLGPDITIVGGARYEADRTEFTATRVQNSGNQLSQPYKIVTVHPDNHFWLPMVQARYKVFEWADVRYSYSKTLSRPDFTANSPFQNADNARTFINAGNPDLLPAESKNHDVMLTLHSNEIGLLSIGGFYKTIHNFVFNTQYQLVADSLTLPEFKTVSYFSDVFGKESEQVRTWINNPYEATLKGVEADWQTRFWYLPFPFDGVVVGVNYTHISSDTKYPYVFVENVLFPGQRRPTPVVRDTSRGGRLVDQPADIVNAYFGYDYKGFSGRISFLYQGQMVGYVSNIPEGDNFTKPYFKMDIALRQTLPWTGFQVYLDVNNINERADISAQQTFNGFTSQQFYGLTADVGIRYTL
jgi:TonB-dependent receptor